MATNISTIQSVEGVALGTRIVLDSCVGAADGSADVGGKSFGTVQQLLHEQCNNASIFDLVQASPEVTSIPGWTPPLTLQVMDASELAPKDETVIFKQHGRIFRKREGEWKERGTGDVMLLTNTNTGCTRFLMWQDRTFKTVANFALVESSSLCCLHSHEDDPKTVEWSCQDHSDGRPIVELFALNFKSGKLACDFIKAFNGARTTTRSAPNVPSGDVVSPCCEQTRAQQQDDDTVGDAKLVSPRDAERVEQNASCSLRGGATAESSAVASCSSEELIAQKLNSLQL